MNHESQKRVYYGTQRAEAGLKQAALAQFQLIIVMEQDRPDLPVFQEVVNPDFHVNYSDLNLTS